MDLKQVAGIAFITLFITSCGNRSEKTTTEDQSFIDHHTAEISLDWSGAYKGILPCADCEGIETTLILNDDNTYILITTYLGKGEPINDTYAGTFTWDINNIELQGVPGSRPMIYKVEENRVRQLDMEGNIITGTVASNYLLIKE